MKKQFIWVTFQVEGIHKYPAALTEPALADVSFLGYPHRHMFHFKVSIQVRHDDRDIEFIQFKRWLVKLFGTVIRADNQSCEMLSDNLAICIVAKYPNRELVIDVSEDGENGSTTYYSGDPDEVI